jgi:hypothetical protein
MTADSNPAKAISPATRAAAEQLAGAALARVQDPATRGVRVEDYLTVLGGITGEAALVAAGVLDIESTDIPPGSPVFGDQINVVLTGDTTDPTHVPADSVVGILIAELVPDTIPLDRFGSLEALYRGVAASVGSTAWGMVKTTVPAANQLTLLPIRVAFELRPAVETAVQKSGLSPRLRHVPCALALAVGLKQVRQAIDIDIGLTLALEVVFGTAKMVPMSRRALAAVDPAASTQAE